MSTREHSALLEPWVLRQSHPETHSPGKPCVLQIGPIGVDHCHWCGPTLDVDAEVAQYIITLHNAMLNPTILKWDTILQMYNGDTSAAGKFFEGVAHILNDRMMQAESKLIAR